jgi:hypothetical protein
MNTLSTLGPTHSLNELFSFEKYSHSMYRDRVASPKFRQFMVSILKRLHLISVLFCYFLFFLVLNFTQLSQAWMGEQGISVFWNCAQRRTQAHDRQILSQFSEFILLCVWPNVWQAIQEANLCILLFGPILLLTLSDLAYACTGSACK